MNRGVWHSVTYDGDVPVQEDFAADNGMLFNFNVGDWWEFRGGKVYGGEHLIAKSPVHLQTVLRSYAALAKHLETCDDPHHATLRMDVRTNAVH